MSNKTEKKTMKQRWNEFTDKHPNFVPVVVACVSTGTLAVTTTLLGYELGKKKMSKYLLPQDKEGSIKALLCHAVDRYPDDFGLMSLTRPEGSGIKVSDLGELGKAASEMFENYNPDKEYTHFLCIGEAGK